MGNRLSKIYTRTGDAGTTGLGDGSRVNKDSLRVQAMGSVDELNAWIGLLLTESLPSDTILLLTEIQHVLFDLGGELCIPGHTMLTQQQTTQLEEALDQMNEQLSPLKEFILPGGSKASAYCHLARTVCRRAERDVTALSRMESVSNEVMQYLNRLSDFLFVLCRHLNRTSGQQDVLWKPIGTR